MRSAKGLKVHVQKRFRFGVPYLRDRRSNCGEPLKFVRCTRPLRACILLTQGCGVMCTCVGCVCVCVCAFKIQLHTQSCALCLFLPALFTLGVTIAQGSHLLRLRNVCVRMFACYKSKLGYVMQVRGELMFCVKM